MGRQALSEGGFSSADGFGHYFSQVFIAAFFT
jgi:hypothetical protein